MGWLTWSVVAPEGLKPYWRGTSTSVVHEFAR
jgi:hypothetical protein